MWVGTEHAVGNYNTGQPIDLDYDDLWNGGADDLVRWDSTGYATLAELAAATGQESHGLSVEPKFAQAASGDYRLDAASALIDAGVLIPGINDDYAGSGPDLGAYESEGYGFSLAVIPLSQQIDPGGVAAYDVAVQAMGGFDAAVTLVAASPSPSLMVSLSPALVAPPWQATLTVTDTHSSPLLPGLCYTVAITGTGGGLTETANTGLLVGGGRLYLPVILKGGEGRQRSPGMKWRPMNGDLASRRKLSLTRWSWTGLEQGMVSPRNRGWAAGLTARGNVGFPSRLGVDRSWQVRFPAAVPLVLPPLFEKGRGGRSIELLESLQDKTTDVTSLARWEPVLRWSGAVSLYMAQEIYQPWYRSVTYLYQRSSGALAHPSIIVIQGAQ